MIVLHSKSAFAAEKAGNSANEGQGLESATAAALSADDAKKLKAEGISKYGDVKFADPKHGKYPIDTEEHIRAALTYISKPDNAAFYSPEELKAVKANIQAAWKKHIDKAGAPSLEEPAKNQAGKTQGYNPVVNASSTAANAAGDSLMDWNEAGPLIAAALGLGNDASPDDVVNALGAQAAKKVPSAPCTECDDPACKGMPCTTVAAGQSAVTKKTDSGEQNAAEIGTSPGNPDKNLGDPTGTLGANAAKIRSLLKAPQAASLSQLLKGAFNTINENSAKAAQHAALVEERDTLRRAVSEREAGEKKALASATFSEFSKKIPAAKHPEFRAECEADPVAFRRKWTGMPDVLPGADTVRGRAPAPAGGAPGDASDPQVMFKNAQAAQFYQQEMAAKGVTLPIWKALQHVKQRDGLAKS